MLTPGQPPTSKTHPEMLPFHLLYILGIHTRFCLMKIFFLLLKCLKTKIQDTKYLTFTSTDMIMNTLKHLSAEMTPICNILSHINIFFLFFSFPNIASPHPPAFFKKDVKAENLND